MKLVINRCYGGFGLSDEAMKKLGLPLTFAEQIAKGKTFFQDANQLHNEELGIVSENSYAHRADPRLLAVVEELGCERASGQHAELEVVEIPDDVAWGIEEYDGSEWVSERHRTW